MAQYETKREIKTAYGEGVYTDWQTEEAAARGFGINDWAYVEPMFSTEDCRRYFGWSSEAESWVACGEGEEAFFDDFYDAMNHAMRRPRTAYGCEYDENTEK